MPKHDPLQQYVEKEKTRVLLMGAAVGGTVTDYWRRVLYVAVVALIAGLYYGANHTKRGQWIVEALVSLPEDQKRRLRPPPPPPPPAPHLGIDGGEVSAVQPAEPARQPSSWKKDPGAARASAPLLEETASKP